MDQDLIAVLDQAGECQHDSEGRPRKGDWMQTYTGRAFWPLDPRADEVAIEDIAHSLSLQCRFAGHCRFHYSVAQHSVLVARSIRAKGLAPELVVWGLLHDAAEAYLVDLPRPVKGVVQGYREAEAGVLRAVAEHFGLVTGLVGLEVVHLADNTALATEKRDVMDKPRREWAPLPDPWPERIERWQPRVAELEFLQMAVKLNLKGAVESLRVMA
jgi:hypothetical protein